MDLFYSALNTSVVWMTPQLCAIVGQTCHDAVQFQTKLRIYRNQYMIAKHNTVQIQKKILSSLYKTKPQTKFIFVKIYRTIIIWYRLYFAIGPGYKRYTYYKYNLKRGLYFIRMYDSKTTIRGFIGNPSYINQYINYNYYTINNKFDQWVNGRSYYTYKCDQYKHFHNSQTIVDCRVCRNSIRFHEKRM